MSQAELGRLVGIRGPSVGAIERGIVRKSAYLLEFAHILGVSPDWLAGKVDDPSPQFTESRITEILKNFSEDEKKEALRLVLAWSNIKRQND